MAHREVRDTLGRIVPPLTTRGTVNPAYTRILTEVKRREALGLQVAASGWYSSGSTASGTSSITSTHGFWRRWSGEKLYSCRTADEPRHEALISPRA